MWTWIGWAGGGTGWACSRKRSVGVRGLCVVRLADASSCGVGARWHASCCRPWRVLGAGCLQTDAVLVSITHAVWFALILSPSLARPPLF